MNYPASIQKIESLTPIEGADRIEVAHLEGLAWQDVVQKGLHEIGNLVCYVEIDSVLPEEPWCEFLRDRNFRVRTIKLRKIASQGLIIPLRDLKDKLNNDIRNVGDDISELINAKHYEKPIPAYLNGMAIGDFPTHLFPKTDEEQLQNSPQVLKYIKENDIKFYATLKADGSSGTFYKLDGELNVCSRNLNLKRPDNLKENSFWAMAEKYNLDDLPEGWGVQGELVGPNIQGNKENLKEHELRIFNVHDFADGKNFISYKDLVLFCIRYGLPLAEQVLLMTDQMEVDKLLDYADTLKYKNGAQAEGFVVRSYYSEKFRKNDLKPLSFKVVSRKFLLKNKE